jgi:nickel-dependent lactate racemase
MPIFTFGNSTMSLTQATAPPNQDLDSDTIKKTLYRGLDRRFTGAKVLVLIPDHTRTIPLPLLFPMLVEILHDARRLDFMVALGTHPPLSSKQLNDLVGITAEERRVVYGHVGLLNHAWDKADDLVQIGVLPKAQIQQIAGDVWHSSLGGDVPVRINRAIHEYDHILILGPTFPHEVAGFSGGAKYLFPGISGPEMINVTHWLSALKGVIDTIGLKDTPVRKMIHAAAELVSAPITLIGLVVMDAGLAGLFIGDYISAWEAAANLSSLRHILWYDKPFERVLSQVPPMYGELWTAAKGMYKLDPVIADGGEVVVFAPHLAVVSDVHGRHIYETGYHVIEYFLKQWDKYKHFPLGVLAHSTHLRGAGRFVNGVEYPRVDVTLASQLPPEDCAQLSLGYMNPDEISPSTWRDRENEGILFVPKAGELLYRVRKPEIGS